MHHPAIPPQAANRTARASLARAYRNTSDAHVRQDVLEPFCAWHANLIHKQLVAYCMQRNVVCIGGMGLSGDDRSDALGAHVPQVGREVRMAMAPGAQAPDVDRELKACLHG